MKKLEVILSFIAILIACYGAGLATYLGIIEFRRERRESQSDIEVQYIESAIGRDFEFLVVNKGYQPVIIKELSVQCEIFLPDGSQSRYVIGSGGFIEIPDVPITLRRFDQQTFIVDFEVIDDISKNTELGMKITARVIDIDDVIYESDHIIWKNN
ncbi:hypothetical protein ACFLUA_01220 [Chloroflexota bacterium]